MTNRRGGNACHPLSPRFGSSWDSCAAIQRGLRSPDQQARRFTVPAAPDRFHQGKCLISPCLAGQKDKGFGNTQKENLKQINGSLGDAERDSLRVCATTSQVAALQSRPRLP